jgi:hypothetical protein
LQDLAGLLPRATTLPGSDLFLKELQSLLPVPSGGNESNNGFDYGTFFDDHRYFQIRSATGDFAMTVQSASMPVSISQLTSPPSDSQLWSFEGGYIVSKLNGDVLTAPASSSQSNQVTISPKITSSISSSYQQWSMDSDGHLICAADKRVVGLETITEEMGTGVVGVAIGIVQVTIQNQVSQASPNQQWDLDSFLPDPGPKSSVISRAIVERAEITSLLRQSWDDDAIDINQFSELQNEQLPVLNMYFERKMLKKPSSQPYVVFSRVRIPGVWSIRTVL